MSERLRNLDDEALRRAVQAVGDRVDWPAQPDVVAAVTRGIRERGHTLSPGGRWLPMSRRRRALVLAIVLVVVLGAAALAAKLVIDLGALTVEVVPGRPTSLPTAPAGASDFGTPVTLARAEAIAGFTPPIPSALGPPDRVWVDRAVTSFDTAVPSTRIVMAWSPTEELPAIPGTDWGAILMTFEGSTDVAAKIVFAEAGSIRHVVVLGTDAYWVTGPHELDLLGPSGPRPHLVTGNVLLWNTGGLVARLETAVDRGAAIAIASST